MRQYMRERYVNSHADTREAANFDAAVSYAEGKEK